MILRARIEIRLTARARRSDSLILQPQIPPRLVVIGRLDFAGEHFPSPLIDQQAEGQEGYTIKRLFEQFRDVVRSFSTPRDVKKPSPYFTMSLASRFFFFSSSVTSTPLLSSFTPVRS